MNESDGTLQVEGAGLTLMSLVGGPVAVNLQMGDDVGETTATFPPQPGGEFYSVTNRGELLIIDLGAETGTLVGKAPSVGWTGLAFSPDGRLFTSSQVRDGNTSDGCLDGWFLLDGKCAHIYQVDPSTGGILTARRDRRERHLPPQGQKRQERPEQEERKEQKNRQQTHQ